MQRSSTPMCNIRFPLSQNVGKIIILLDIYIIAIISLIYTLDFLYFVALGKWKNEKLKFVLNNKESIILFLLPFCFHIVHDITWKQTKSKSLQKKRLKIHFMRWENIIYLCHTSPQSVKTISPMVNLSPFLELQNFKVRRHSIYPSL